MCDRVTLTASEMLAQCFIPCQNSLAFPWAMGPLMSKSSEQALGELGDTVR